MTDRSELQVQKLSNKRTKAHQIRQLLKHNRRNRHSNLGRIAHTLKIHRNPNQLRNESHARINAILRAMMMTSNAIHQEKAKLREPDSLIRA